MISVIGSFALVCVATVILLSQSARWLYPAFRRRLFGYDPRTASGMLLAWILAPVVLSIAVSILLFVPALESRLVAQHCHADCGAHLPLAASDWLIGLGVAILLATLLGAAGAALRQWFGLRRLARNLQSLGEIRADHVLLHQNEPVAFTLGWWRNRIYISQGLLERCGSEELDIIFAHEAGHARRKDNLRMLAARLALVPLSITSLRRVSPGRSYPAQLLADLQLLTESACDFIAATQHSGLSVAESLLKVHRLMAQTLGVPQGASAFAAASTEERVRMLLNAPHKRLSASAVTLASLAMLMLLILSIHPLHHLSELLL